MKKSIELDAPIRFMCNHMIGKNHTERHRRLTGLAIMVIGVSIAMTGHETSSKLVAFSGDLIGYLLHGMGAIPIIKKYLE